jgi:hypothetical protein
MEERDPFVHTNSFSFDRPLDERFDSNFPVLLMADEGFVPPSAFHHIESSPELSGVSLYFGIW